MEKIVEKPVDRIVEKLIPAECPKTRPSTAIPKSVRHEKQATTTQPALLIPPGTTINATTSAPDSAAVGVNTGTVTVNPPVNANAGTTTYDCAGNKRWTGPTATAAMSTNLEVGKEADTSKRLVELANSGKYSELLEDCEQKMTSAPEWLTPYLFCSLGNLATGHPQKAKDILSQYDRKKGPAYESNPCTQLSDYLHSHL